MVAKREELTPAETLDKHVREHRAWVDQWREEHGDPQEALRIFLRNWVDQEAMEETYREYRENKASWLDRYEEDREDGDAGATH